MIAPIETVYNGYRFRSRLEARWAVFFDSAGIQYEYEPEGFYGYLKKPYLPDFYLPTFNVYAEVKGSYNQLCADAEKMLEAIDFNSTPCSNGLIILGQIPYSKHGNLMPVFSMLYCDSGVMHTPCLFDEWKGRTYLTASKIDAYEAISYGINYSDVIGDTNDMLTHVFTEARYIDIEDEDVLVCTDPWYINRHYLAARQARFEHGETPQIGR